MPELASADWRDWTDAQRFQLLVNAVRDYAIYMTDPRGRVSSWNLGAENVFGYADSEIVGQHFERFYDQADDPHGIAARALREAEFSGRYDSEGWFLRRDGRRFWASLVIDPVRDASDRLLGFAHVARDITDRREAQQALFASEMQFRMLVNGVIDYAIYLLDPNGNIATWNAGAERIKGYAADEVIGHHYGRFYSREDRLAGLPVRALEAARRDGRYEAEGWRHRKDGSRFWASVVLDAIRGEDGQLVGFAKITRDITERRLAQEALRESERQFRLLVNGVTDCALYMLDPNGNVASWNSGAQRIKGYAADEVIGHHFSRFYTPEDRRQGVPARALRLALENGRHEIEGWRVRKDGSLFWANAVIEAVRDDDGQHVGFAKVTRDVSEKRAAEAALRKAQEQLAHSQKMEALGQLTGGIAHDFNNLLMVVTAHLRTIGRALGDNPDCRRAVEAIQTAAKRGSTLTRQLLTFARRQVLHPVVVDPAERIAAFREVLASSLGGLVQLHIEPFADVWNIAVDVSELELALLNIALNARDAMPQGGTITLSAQNVRLARGDVGSDLEGEFVALTVSDTGVGIAPEILPKIFDPFFSTKALDKGTGLGLSQVYGFAHQSGGTVKVSSQVGVGTKITLHLPRAQEGVTYPSPSPVASSRLVAERARTILLVEDNAEVAEVCVEMLQEIGFAVRHAEDAGTALRLLEQEAPIDAIVSDIVMPGAMDGIALAQEIRRRRPGLPVVLVTGFSKAAQGAHGFTVLQKPYEPDELQQLLVRAWDAAEAPASGANLVDLGRAKWQRSGDPAPRG